MAKIHKVKRIDSDGAAKPIKRYKKHAKEHYQRHYNRLCKLLDYETYSCGVNGVKINLTPDNRIDPETNELLLFGAQKETTQERLNEFNKTIKELKTISNEEAHTLFGLFVEPLSTKTVNLPPTMVNSPSLNVKYKKDGDNLLS